MERIALQAHQPELARLVEDRERARLVASSLVVNNAGAIYFRRYLSVDGIEMNFAGNHLAYFLLTNLLLETMISSSHSRIINVSSSSHIGQVIDFDDLECQNNYQIMQAYGKSKLANILFTYELARAWRAQGSL